MKTNSSFQNSNVFINFPLTFVYFSQIGPAHAQLADNCTDSHKFKKLTTLTTFIILTLNNIFNQVEQIFFNFDFISSPDTDP